MSPYSLSVGTNDYYTNAIPNVVGTGYNVGAYGAATFTTLNPAALGAGITLSNGNLTATAGATSGVYHGFRSIAGHSSGKFFSEATLLNPMSAGDALQIGVSDALVNLDTYLGIDLHAAGTFGATDALYLNNNPVGTIGSYGISGDIISQAVDLTAMLYWLSVNGGNWNANPSANPDTGVGGLPITALAGGPWFCAGAMNNQGATTSMTFNFGATAYSHKTNASTFGNW